MSKVFIDFGPGKNDKTARRMKANGYHTIGIDYDKREIHDDPDWGFDRMIYAGWHEVEEDLKADAWRCSSCLEHTQEDEIEESVAAIANLIKSDTNGWIHIDLTDHRGGFAHYESDYEWAAKRTNSYINTVRCDEWFNIIDRYFVITKCELKQKHGGGHPTAIDFWVGGVK